MDVSTGLYPNIDESAVGTHNGERYTGTVTEIYPDHLALLPNEQGACSKEKGCGTHIHTNCKGKPTCSCKLKAEQAKPSIWSNAFQLVKGALGFRANEASHDEIREKIRSALRATLTSPDYWPYIMDVYDNFFVYELDSILFKQGYAMDATESVILAGEPIKVIIKREYVPVDPLLTNTNKTTMKPRIISLLAGMLAANQITTEQHTTICGLQPNALDAMFPDPVNPVQATVPAVPAVVTNGLSDEDRQLLNELKANHASRKTALVAHVQTNYPKLDKAIVANMDLPTLEALASAAPGGSPIVNFSLAAGGGQMAANEDEDEGAGILLAPYEAGK
jgi:hypothetical protein